jgi:hypothetical protein
VALDAAAWLLIGLAVFDWVAAGGLIAADRRAPGIDALHERAIAQVLLAVAATLFAGLGGIRLGVVPPQWFLPMLVAAGVIVSVPGILWLVTAWREWL